MEIEADSQVLDVGCGPAIDTIALSEYIGDEGRIVGVDNDPEMIKKADAQLTESKVTKNVKHIQADVLSLPFGESEFDRVHAERLFQVLPKSAAPTVLTEINRVLRTGGRLVVVDTDWGSVSVNFSGITLERRLMSFFATQMRSNGFAGRELLQLFHDNGYTNLVVEVYPYVLRTFSETPFDDWLITEAAKNKVTSKEELSKWRSELTEKTEQGTFLYHVDMILVAGTKK